MRPVSALAMFRDESGDHQFVTYDRKLAAAAQDADLMVVAPA